MIRYPLIALATGLLAASCAPPDTAETYRNTGAKRETAALVAPFPRVVSPGWRVMGNGKPSLDVTGYCRVSWVRDGSPQDVVEVFYHGSDNPRVTTDDSSTVTVMGRSLQTYDSGNEDPAFATQPVWLTAPDGRSGYYSFQFHNRHLHKTRDIPRFGW